jgi:ferritin-like metal-binding protein YciE
MSVTNLRQLFEHELKDIYFAEHKLVEALEQLAEEAVRPEARKAFQAHQKETRQQIKRLDRVFKALGEPPEPQTCPGIEGLLKEKLAFSKEKPSPELLAFYNLGAGAKTERYEITAYEGLIELAESLALPDAAELLRENLAEEEAALAKLQELSKNYDKAPLQGA